MPSALRSAVPVLAILAGSWVGLGAPWMDAALARPRRWALDHANAAARADVPSPPRDATRPSVDPQLLPDPTPWPRLNPDASLTLAWLQAEGPLHPAGDGRRLIALTFDDGPFPETTPVVLHVLAKHRVHATFFWIGRYLDGDSPRAVATRLVAKQVDEAGHLVGNHTHDHVRLTTLSHAEQVAQIDDAAESVARAIGKRPVLFRPPYGKLDGYSQELLRARGQTLVLWSVEAGDMKRDDPQGMADSLRDQIEYAGGGIVLLHDIRFTSADALDKLLTWVDSHHFDPNRPEKTGYEVVDLPEYLRATAAAPQPYANREDLEKARAVEWKKRSPSVSAPAVMLREEPVM
jgi:peptidoglycan/xylan/chitin deacetylase (PgdA/CDA1 family)